MAKPKASSGTRVPARKNRASRTTPVTPQRTEGHRHTARRVANIPPAYQPGPGKHPADDFSCRTAERGLRFPMINTPHDTALQELAALSDVRLDTISAHHTYLVASPAFPHFLQACKSGMAAPGLGSSDPDWYLGRFAAEMFYAGVFAGRRENARREEHFGDLILDGCAGRGVHAVTAEPILKAATPARKGGAR